MGSEEAKSDEKAAVAASGPAALKPALEKLAASLDKLDILEAEKFVAHLKSLPKPPDFYGQLPKFPKKPTDPYEKAASTGDMPTHDAEIEYEDDVMFYRNECIAFAKELAKACRGSAGVIQ